MSKLLKIAVHEYRRNVFKKSFIFALMSVPLMVVLNVVIVFVIIAMNSNNAPIGYVDYARLLDDPIPAPERGPGEPVSFIAFETEDEARAALEAENIQAYYVVTEDYFETNRIDLFYFEEPGENAADQFWWFVRVNGLSDQPPEIIDRIANGNDVLIRTPDGSRVFPSDGPPLGTVLPPILSVVFVFLLMMSSGWLMGGVTDEKENRTMEVLLTSVSPTQMVAGKVLGIVGISFTQLVTWILFGAVAVFISGSVAGIEWFQNLGMDWGGILTVVAIAIPSYVLTSAVMFTIGATVAAPQEGQSLTGMFMILHMLPAYVLGLIGENPNAPLAVTMSLLPFTSLLTVGVRHLFTAIPLWQIAASVGLQTLYATGALWLAGRAFRLGMLRYGQRLKLRELFVRAKSETPQLNTIQGGDHVA